MFQQRSSRFAPIIQRVVHLTEATQPELIDGLRKQLVDADQTQRATAPVTLVEICRGAATYCLTIDTTWLDFAAQARQVSPTSLDELDVPPASVVAILDGPYGGWLDADWDHTKLRMRPDGVVIVSKPVECGPE